MGRHRDSFQSNIGGPEGGFQGQLDGSREVHQERQQGLNREAAQSQLGTRFEGGQDRGFKLLRPRFVEILHPNQTWYQDPKYEEVDYYQRQGARKKDFQGREQVVHRDPTQLERAPQVPPFRQQSTQTEEQWETIRSVAQTMSHGTPKQGLGGAPKSPSQHQYEVPRSPQDNVRMPHQQQYSQDQRSLHQDESVLRLDPEREKPKKHYFAV